MLHTKFRGNRATGCGEKDVLRVFYHIWAWWPPWSCDTDAASKLLLPLPMEASQKLVLIDQAVSEKKMFDI